MVEDYANVHQARSQQWNLRPENPTTILSSIRRDAASIINGNVVPSELQILELLDGMESFANLLVFGEEDGRRPEKEDLVETTARASTSPQADTSSALLDDLCEDTSTQKAVKVSHRSSMSVAFRNKSAEALCEVLYHLTRDPKVNINLPILRFYTRIQCLLGKPEYLPEIFDLYAHKPAASQSGSTIKYKPRTPWRRSAAVPLDLASAALATAIHKRDLVQEIPLVLLQPALVQRFTHLPVHAVVVVGPGRGRDEGDGAERTDVRRGGYQRHHLGHLWLEGVLVC